MATDDLSSITGMEDKHRRVLARKQITTFRGLVSADQHVIYRAMGSIRPRPTLKQIAQWQGEARGKLDEPVADTTDWHTAASFAVVFAQRQAGSGWERRIEAERTEVEPEREPEVWPGWECSPICGWMLGQLGQTDTAGPGQADRAVDSQARPAGPPHAEEPAGPAQLHVDSAAIIDATRKTDVVTGGALVADPPAELVAPLRVVFVVSGARPGTEVQAVARLRGRGQPGRNAQDPVVVPASGRAEFDLSQVTAGELEMALLAWAPDATARPVAVRLPAMRIGPGSG